MMNLKEFTDIVDKVAESLSREELQCLIHSISRKVPEEKRSSFVKLLEDMGTMGRGKKDKEGFRAAVRNVDRQEIQREYERLKGLFESIESGELCIQAEGYEDYSMGYGGGDWVWEYEDPEDVCQTYADACRLIQRCVNDGVYREASDLFDIMMEAELTVENDWDVFGMGLEELVQENLVSADLENLALYVLYAAYQEAKPETRAEMLYYYFNIPFFKNVQLEKMLVLGREELEGLPQFWESWIKLLTGKSGDTQARLLKEAVISYQGEGGLLDAARLACDGHPSLYLEALGCLEASHDGKGWLEAGKEALERVKESYVIRSEIALKTAEAAFSLGEDGFGEKCWLEALSSSTTPVNYLRLIAESRDPKAYEADAKRIVLAATKGGSHTGGVPMELRENSVTGYNHEILRFLTGDFEYAMAQCCKVKEALGWTDTFAKCGIALFLLLLLKKEKPGPGCLHVADNLIYYLDFTVQSYYKGTKAGLEHGRKGTALPDTRQVFLDCFDRWKAGHVLLDGQAAGYLSAMERMIDKRVRAIVGGQYRNHYEDAAVLAAALGEVKASFGQPLAKEEILQKYKAEFPRHSSFHAALRNCGMQDTKKHKQ